MTVKHFIIGAGAAMAVSLAACGPQRQQKETEGEVVSLEFAPSDYRTDTLRMPSGEAVAYRAYEGIYYVGNVEDSVYQNLNIYVPVDTKGRKDSEIPILLRQYVGGYRASAAKTPSATDATGRALQEGYVVCIPGVRGSNSVVIRDGKKVYTGVAPNGLLDLKAVVRYLRYNDARIPGNSERIFIDGTSAGGAMSALIGTTANREDYRSYLEAMKAADAKDNVYGAICYCPITDLNHADMEYEWLYGCTNRGVRKLDSVQCRISDELAALAPDYINSLKLRDDKGELITADNYREYLKGFIAASAHKALEEGADIPESTGIVRLSETPFGDDGRAAPSFGPGGAAPEGKGGQRPVFNMTTDFVESVDLDKYLSYVATVQPLKTPPAFDQMGVIIPTPSPENEVFADAAGVPANFTDFSLEHRLHNPSDTLSAEQAKRVYLMNPMNFIGESVTADVAPKWYIRHGAKDRDTSFLVPINLATKLKNAGYDVNFFLPWNRPHSGDYNLDDLFAWIEQSMTSTR